MVPKPRSKHQYCAVCRGHYEDYKEHTEDAFHRDNLKKSRYQELIEEMCSQFRDERGEEIKEEKEKEGDVSCWEEGKNVPELVETMSTSKGIFG